MKSKTRCAAEGCYKARNPQAEYCQYHDPATRDTAGKRCAAFTAGERQCMRAAHPERSGTPSVYCRPHQVARAPITREDVDRKQFMDSARDRINANIAATRAALERL